MPRPYLSPRRMRLMCERFNEKHPVGSEAMVFTGVVGEDGKIATVRSKAEILSGHTPVAWFEGISGCVALTHVRPVPVRV